MSQPAEPTPAARPTPAAGPAASNLGPVADPAAARRGSVADHARAETVDPAASKLGPVADHDRDELLRLVAVMHTLRGSCPWDAEQTHRSLATYLVEEAGETLDAIETGDDTDLEEELGDLLLQVLFHAEIAAEEHRFSIGDVAQGIADKLIRRHPYVFTDAAVPEDLMGSWEARKRAEKGRTSSLDGIPEHLSSLARAGKVISRSRRHGVEVGLPSDPVPAAEVGEQIVALVARAQASGIDADQAVRDAVRALEERVKDAERGAQ